MRTGIILGTLLSIASACSHGAGHTNSAAALRKAAPTTMQYSPAQEAVLKEVELRGKACRKLLDQCTEPQSTCTAKMNACAYQTVLDLNI